jgi:hypothetical protein
VGGENPNQNWNRLHKVPFQRANCCQNGLMVSAVRLLGVSGLGLMTVAVMACATAQSPEDEGPYTPSGGQVGAGGSATKAGSSGASSLPTAGSTTLPSGGGMTSTGTGTAGTTGTGTGTAGTATTATGGAAGTGTGTTGTCPPYTGALAKDSTTFMGGFGKATTGMWSGYGYTYKYGTATVAPGMGTSCFALAKMCANGSVPAADNSGAGLGWNISQAMGASTMAKVAVTTPVTLKFAGVTAGMRVQLSASATVSYCYTLTDAEAAAGAATIPLASFKTECWGTTGMAYDGVVPIEAIQVAVPGSTAGAAKTFDLCLLDIEPG